MEREPKEPTLKDNCMHCNTVYPITCENAALFVFTRKADCNYLQTECTNCGGDTRLFMQDGGDTAQKARQLGITEIVTDYPPDNIYQSFLKVFGIELIQEKELTPRQENRVKYLGFLLAKDLIVPESFTDDTRI